MADTLLGRTVGNYTVLRKLGEGGMGSVYEAEHPGIGRRAAIKVLRPHLAGDADLVARFFREARAVNQVRHPNVVQVLDLGTTPEGTIYAIMELLEGESLAARLRRVRRLGVGEAVAIFDAVAGALEVVHAKGIVHRDLKPDNIFLAREGDREVVKVLDFGVAKLMDGADANLSQTGAIIGTPAYMSPEQCEGQREVDARTDVYAMGCVLYHMLAGVPPFLADSVTKMIMMHVSAPAPPARNHRPELPEPIEALIAQALAKRADERLQSMRAFRNALRTAAAEVMDSAVSTLPEMPAPQPQFPDSMPAATTLGGAAGQLGGSAARRRRAPLVAGAALALVAAGVTAFLLLRNDAEHKPEQAANTPASPSASPSPSPSPSQAPAPAAAPPSPSPSQPPSPPPAAPRANVSAATCTSALAHAATLMTSATGVATRPYRHFARFSSDADVARDLNESCLHDFDDAALACLAAAATASDVVTCGDDLLGRRCAAGGQRDCASMAWKAFEDGQAERAGELARGACAAGVGQGCSALGVLLYYGRGGAVDLAGAAANFSRGMAVDDPNAYGYAGHFAEYGIGAAPDLAEARRRFQTACKLDPAHSACARAAFLEAAGQGGSRDGRAAAAHARAACDNDIPDGCRFLGDAAKGAEQTELWTRALGLYQERAALLPLYRLHLGEMRIAGHGVAADLAAGAADVSAACSAHEPAACQVLGQLHVGGQLEVDVTRALAANRSACSAGLPPACAAAACQELLDPARPAPAPAELERCKQAGHLGPVAKRKDFRRPVRSAPKSPRRDDDLLMD